MDGVMLRCVPFEPLFRGLVIKQPISFDDMQSLRVRRAIPIDHGKRPDLNAHGVDDQRVVFVMAHGIAVPGRGHLSRMRLIQAHVTDLMIVAIQYDDLIRRLQHLRWAI